MKLLKCKICLGEVDIVGNERAINKKIKCRKCGHSNESDSKGPEVVIIRKRPAITYTTERTKSLNEITSADVPRGIDPDDIAFKDDK